MLHLFYKNNTSRSSSFKRFLNEPKLKSEPPKYILNVLFLILHKLLLQKSSQDSMCVGKKGKSKSKW